MQAFIDAWAVFLREQNRFWREVNTHLTLSGTALLIAIVICVPLGIIIARRLALASVVINIFNGLRVVPSLVVLFLALPYLGTGFRPSLVALTILACPPILLNTYAGLRGVDPATSEAARGMGMSSLQALWRVELPLALPAIIAGIRTAAVEVIASATLAAFIAGNGLGNYIQRGFAINQPPLMIVGAVAVALLAITAELLFGGLQRVLSPRRT